MRIVAAFAAMMALAGSASAAEFRNVPWTTGALLGVGQAMVVHSVRGERCNAPAPSWRIARKRLPKIRYGVFSDGGVGWRWSGQCEAFVKARAVVYTARRKGTETFYIYDTDRTTVTVR